MKKTDIYKKILTIFTSVRGEGGAGRNSGNGGFIINRDDIKGRDRNLGDGEFNIYLKVYTDAAFIMKVSQGGRIHY